MAHCFDKTQILWARNIVRSSAWPSAKIREEIDMKPFGISVLLVLAVAMAIPELAAARDGYGGFRGVHGGWVGWGYGPRVGWGYGRWGYGWPPYPGYGYIRAGSCWQSVRTLAGPATTYVCH
jgi:hypothetical protein